MTIAELLAQSPDAKTLEGARRLFFSRRWRTIAGDGNWLWGEFEVNGPQPLRTAVDLINGHFFCTCRSRRRPCTHALSLVMVLGNQADRITVASPPEWALLLREKTIERNEQAAAPSSLPQGDMLDAKRARLMDQGLTDLELRLLDLMDRGLADTNAQGEEFWLDTAARLTDAKLSGMANRLRSVIAAGDDSTVQLNWLGDAYLAIRAWRNRDQLDPKQREELYRYLGLNVKKDQLAQRPGKNDHWLVMGSFEGVEDRLRYRRVWLRGEKCKRYALLLEYAFGERPFERGWALGSSWSGKVQYYPGSYPQRAIFSYPTPGGRPYEGLRGYADFDAMSHDYQRALALNPWLPSYPVYFQAITPRMIEGNGWLIDATEKGLPMEGASEQLFTLLGLSYGEPVSLFGEFDGHRLRPLSVVMGSGLVGL